MVKKKRPLKTGRIFLNFFKLINYRFFLKKKKKNLKFAYMINNLQPQEVEILNEFQTRLQQCKKTKELLVLSPRAYIDKRIDEIIASKNVKTEEFQYFQDSNESKEKDNSMQHGSSFHHNEPLYTKPNKSRLVVTSIKTFESNRKLLSEEQNKENKVDNSREYRGNYNPTQEKNVKTASLKKKKEKETSCENKKPQMTNEKQQLPLNLGKKGEVKKICNKK